MNFSKGDLVVISKKIHPWRLPRKWQGKIGRVVTLYSDRGEDRYRVKIGSKTTIISHRHLTRYEKPVSDIIEGKDKETDCLA